MIKERIEGFTVIGITARARNDDPASIGALWERFYGDGVRDQVPARESDDVYCVYHDYDGGHADPFSMTIGYRAPAGAESAAGLSRVDVPAQSVAAFEAVGPQPDALISTWGEIWRGDLDRAFIADFDLYDAAQPDRARVHVGLKD